MKELAITNDRYVDLLFNNKSYFEKTGFAGGIAYGAIYCYVTGNLIAYKEMHNNQIEAWELVNK